jgi:tripartite-type tricarboxylate transporter receptor subunit TctC
MLRTVARKSWIAVFALLTSGYTAEAQWPNRTITMTVAFAAGGVTDGIARQIGMEIAKQVHQDVVIENKGGAGGNIAAYGVSRAAPDGYSLLFASSGPTAINKLIYKNMPYDPTTALAPIALVALIPQIIVAKNDLPVSTLKEFVDYARARPGRIAIGNAGLGTGGHISAVLFARQTGIQVTHVPYRGTAPLTNDLMGGQIDAGFPGFFPQTTSLKMLAVTSSERLEALPSVPTVRETGVTDTVSGVWYGLLAPAGTPRPVLDRINKIVNDYLITDGARRLASTLGMRILGGTPEAMRDYMAAELHHLEPIIRDAGISAD